MERADEMIRRHARRNLAVVTVAVLYIATWVGGPGAHERQLANDATALYAQAEAHEKGLVCEHVQLGGPAPRRITLEGGPKTRVNWCVPILPGILVSDSYYVVGPLYGQGGVSIILYYGFGCFQIGPIIGWVS